MKNKASMLSKMADLILKSTDRVDAYEKQRELSNRIKKIHEGITERYRFCTAKGYSTSDVEKDAESLKKIQNKISLSEQEKTKLESLFLKYGD